MTQKPIKIHYRYRDPNSPHFSKAIFHSGFVVNVEYLGKFLKIVRNASIAANNFKLTPIAASQNFFVEFSEGSNRDDLINILKKNGLI